MRSATAITDTPRCQLFRSCQEGPGPCVRQGMATLNITFQGLSTDVPLELDRSVTDADVRRIAVEVVRSGGVPGLHRVNLPEDTFVHYVVDRFRGPRGEQRIYLRPKVPFGA